MSLNNLPKIIKPSIVNETIDVFLLNDKDLAVWKSKIALLCQGQAVQISEGAQIGTMALIFAMAYDLADELSIKMKNGETYLVFNHSSKNFVRENEVDFSIFKLIESYKKKKSLFNQEKTGESDIDLSFFWPDDKQKNLTKAINVFFDSLLKDFYPKKTLVLRGDIPAPALLAVLEILRPLVKNIVYRENGKDLKIFPQN